MDYFHVDTTSQISRRPVIINMEMPAGADYDLTVYDENGNQVGMAVENEDGTKTLTIPCDWSNSRRFVIKVSQNGSGECVEGNYKLTFSQGEMPKDVKDALERMQSGEAELVESNPERRASLSLLSMLIHIINSIFSGVYISQFLKCKQSKKTTIILWTLTYFVVQVIIFEVIQNLCPFNDVVSAIINVLLLLGMQWIFFRNGALGQLFVCFSFVAGKEIVKYIVSVLSIALGTVICGFIDALVMQGKIVTNTQVEVANNIVMCVSSFTSAILYALILGIYLILINKKYVRKEYPLQVQENVFLVLPSIAAVCISITLKMMIITVENGTTTLIFDTVPETLFWIPAICVLLLGAVIANVMLFQNVVQYHEENKKATMLENQIQQMQKEVQEIQDIYADMRGLRHDLRGHR